MSAAIAFVIKNWRHFVPAAVIVALILVAWHIYKKGRDDAIDKVSVEGVKIEREVQNEKDRIRNNRLDRFGVIDSLFSGSF